MDHELKDRIHKTINLADIVLFMKGDKYLPKCGFSAHVVEILDSLEIAYTSYDILEDEPLRQGLKEHSNWPTYPQLYVKGKLVGGCDIVTELYKQGKLLEICQSK